MIRVGFGFDVHKLEDGKPFWLGGISIPSDKGSVGHSDADVLIHSICDALLGAAGLKDIGFHFPDTDPRLKGIQSVLLLRKVLHLIHDEGYEVGNVDCTISLQEPRISPFIDQMKETLASALEVPVSRVSIKATTTEQLGYEGRREGISAYAVALINEKA
jgi:2-C-methyl-D-erythritol 2,4-cyclodiphosphate synthase